MAGSGPGSSQAQGQHDPSAFVGGLLSVPRSQRDRTQLSPSRRTQPFNTTASRFERRRGARIPGPGHYDSAAAPAPDGAAHRVHSRRGAGGLAGNASRMPHARAFTGPGPGSYRGQAKFLSKPDYRDPNALSSSFAQPAGVAPPHAPVWKRKEGRDPGPGSYTARIPRLAGGNPTPGAVTVAFRDSQPRFPRFRPTAGPSPGAYEAPSSIRTVTEAPRSFFKDTAGHSGFPNKHASGKKSFEELLLAEQGDAREPDLGATGEPVGAPTQKLRRPQKAQRSSMFHLGAKTDRFGRPLGLKAESSEPGPGAYDPTPFIDLELSGVASLAPGTGWGGGGGAAAEHWAQQTGRSASRKPLGARRGVAFAQDARFRSGRGRGEETGPGGYDPMKPGKKSFHVGPTF
ncbi:unnamed protein product [Pedinophyceae sp. YPF-701]|nr:unnamed protein product [Pedinophyceae sp. YPF-701]